MENARIISEYAESTVLNIFGKNLQYAYMEKTQRDSWRILQFIAPVEIGKTWCISTVAKIIVPYCGIKSTRAYLGSRTDPPAYVS